MSRLDTLIKEYCLNGVTYDTLGNLGKFYGGLSGKTKSDFSNGNSKFISYMNIFSNPALDVDVDTKVHIKEDEKQHTIQYGDIIFTGSSENKDECGMSSVLTTITDENLYLNSFCFGFRFDNPLVMLPEFSKYLFRSTILRKQINKTASGVTRFNVSKKKMEKVEIPLPPIPVQAEIVRILDDLTRVTNELKAELEQEKTARQSQYDYYRDGLFDFGDDVIRKPLGEVSTLVRGNGLPKSDFTETGIGCIHYGQIYTYYGIYTSITKSFVSESIASKLKKVNTNDIIITNTSENYNDVCKCVVWLGEHDIVTGGHATIIKGLQVPKFFAYYSQTKMFYDKKVKYANGIKVIDVSASNLSKIEIPLPSLIVQQRIVDILDELDLLNKNILASISDEIIAREQQYEHYQDKILTFKEKEVLNNG